MTVTRRCYRELGGPDRGNELLNVHNCYYSHKREGHSVPGRLHCTNHLDILFQSVDR